MPAQNVGDTGTAVSTAAAATVNHSTGFITTEALTTAAAAIYTFTLTNNNIGAASTVLVSIGNGTNSAGAPVVVTVTVSNGQAVIVVKNVHASAALNGTLTIAFAVLS